MHGRRFCMRWIIRGRPGPSADGLGPRPALNTARPSTGPRLAPNTPSKCSTYSLCHRCNRSTAQAVQMTWRGPSYRAGFAHLRKARNESLTAMVQAICDKHISGGYVNVVVYVKYTYAYDTYSERSHIRGGHIFKWNINFKRIYTYSQWIHIS